jgi:hypothetical protein
VPQHDDPARLGDDTRTFRERGFAHAFSRRPFEPLERSIGSIEDAGPLGLGEERGGVEIVVQGEHPFEREA